MFRLIQTGDVVFPNFGHDGVVVAVKAVVGSGRKPSATLLQGAARACFEAMDVVGECPFHGGVVADFKVKKVKFLAATPITAIHW